MLTILLSLSLMATIMLVADIAILQCSFCDSCCCCCCSDHD